MEKESSVSQPEQEDGDKVISMEELRRENQLQKEELKRLQKVISQQKDKNNELRQKTWKAKDAMVELQREMKTLIKEKRKLESGCNGKDKIPSNEIVIHVTEKELVLQCELEDAKEEVAYWKALEMESKDTIKCYKRLVIHRENERDSLKQSNENLKKIIESQNVKNNIVKSDKLSFNRYCAVLERRVCEVLEANSNLSQELEIVKCEKEWLESDLAATKSDLEAQKKKSSFKKVWRRMKACFCFKNARNFFTVNNLAFSRFTFAN